MSADDFQTKYASVMESIFKSAVAETTKLFETMVDELKSEISRIRKENEDLKARCRKFESVTSKLTVCTRETEPLPGRSDGSEKRDTAVQCDLVASHTLLIEQSQPLSFSPLQNQKHHSYEGVVYALQEHDYDTRGNLEMAFTFIKHESALKQEDVESTVVSGDDLSDKEGPFINTPCSNREIPLSQRQEEDQMALELPFLGRYNGLQGPENQSSEPGHSLVTPIPEVKEDMDEESEISLKISEIRTQCKLMTSEKHQFLVAQHQSEVETTDKEQPSVVSPQCQSEGQTSVNEQTNVTLQHRHVQSTQEQLAQPTPLNKGVAHEELSNRFPEVETSSQPEVVRCRRGRPPERAKRLQRPVKEILQSLSSEVPIEKEVGSPQVCPVQTKESSTIIPPLIQERENSPLKDVENSEVVSQEVSVVSQLSLNMKEGAVQTPSTIVSSAVETINTPPAASPQATSVLTTECSTSVTLQDAMLLLEAMNQSAVENVSSSPQRTAAPHKTQCGPRVGALEIADEVPAQTTPHPFKTHEHEDNLPRMELSTTTQSTKEKLSAPRQTTDVTPASEVQAHIKVVTPKQQHTHTLGTATTSSMPSSTQTSLQSLQQHYPHPLITSIAPSRRGSTLPHKIIVVSRSVSSSISAQTPTQQPAVVSTGSTAADLPLRTPSLSSVAEKTIYVASSKLLPVVTQSTTKSTDLTSGTMRHSEIKTIIPRQESAEASRPSQTIFLTPQPDSTKSPALSTVSSLQLSSSQESNVSGGAQITILSQKRHNTADSLESPKKTASVSGIHAHTETCSSLNMSVWPVQAISPTFEQKLSCVVRLTRLPFPISTKDSVFVSRLPTNASWDSHFILKEGTIQGKLSSDNITHPDICPGLKGTAVAMSVHTSVIPEEPNDIQEKSSLSSENFATLEELPDNGFVQTSTPYNVSQPVFEKSAMAVNATEPSAVSGTAVELTSNVDKEIINIVVQDCSFFNDQPIEEEESATLLHSSSITSKDTCNPHSQLIKSQFLAQLLVSPVAQDPEKPSSNESVDARASCTGSSTSDKKRLHKTPLMDRLRSHIKTQLQARRTETNPELHTETRPKLENDHPNQKNTTSEHILLSTITSTNKSTFIGPWISRHYKDGVTPKITANEPCSVSYRTPMAKSESSSGRGSVGSKNKISTFGSPRRSSSAQESFACEKTQNISVHPRRTSSARHDASPKSVKTGGSPNNTKTSSGRQKRTTLSQDDISPKRTKSTMISPKASDASKNCSSCKTSTNASHTVIRRRFNFTKDGSYTVQIKRKTNSKNTKSQTDCPSVGGPKLAKDGSCPKKTRECTSIKKPRLIQDATSPKKNSRGMNTKKLAKAKTVAKMRNSNQSQNGAKTSQLAANHASCATGKKCTTTAVWTPPKALPAAENKSAPLPAQKETMSPRSQDHPVVYPPSVPLHPIPFRAPPVISPLQPLSVIGRRLLKNQCGECGRVLSSSAALESHVSLHKGRRPFSCSLCGKSFTDSKGLKRHGRVHRNGRIHVCQQCGKGFVYKFGLTKHIQMVHRRLKPFVCQICNKGCFTKLDVEAHIRVHTGEKPFHCNLCERKFARRGDLNLHLRWHNGEKRHWCPYCGKGFLDSNNLKRHKYTHTGEKPHPCPHCPKHFTQSGHLKKHVKNVHRLM